jgi:hypothetical protein
MVCLDETGFIWLLAPYKEGVYPLDDDLIQFHTLVSFEIAQDWKNDDIPLVQWRNSKDDSMKFDLSDL